MKRVLTQNELEFYKKFLDANDCGANTAEELLEDNYSCQTHLNLRDLFPDLSNNQIGGYIASLTTKGFLYTEEGDGPLINESQLRNFAFTPDLIWADEDGLEILKNKGLGETKFSELVSF